MKRPLCKLLSLVFLTGLISGCGQTISKENFNSKQTVNKSENKSKDNSTASSKPGNSDSSSSSKTPISISIPESSSIKTPDSSVEHNPNDCNNHQLVETILKKATLLEKGIKNYTCANCHADFNDYYYDLDEFVFSDMTFMYDGNPHRVLIEGVLPYGVTVEYENNSLTDIGSKEATAKIYDEEHNLLVEKKANIHIIQNIGVPNIKITTEDGEDPNWKKVDGDHPYKGMTTTIDNCDSKYTLNDVPGEMKVRGNSTNQEQVAKRAFRLKFSSKQNLLGLNEGQKEKSWVLLADFFDQSMFRNACAFNMGGALFNHSGYYSSDYKHVNLYMNGEYRGVYLLAEQQQAKKSRIPINETEDETGASTRIGYLLEIDGLVNDDKVAKGYIDGDPCFKSSSAGKVDGVSISSKGYVIKTDTFSDAQKDFIKKYINNTTKAFANTVNGTLQVVDEEGEIHDSPYNNAYDTLNYLLDLDSFFRMYTLQEFVKNFDVGWGSFYLYVDFSNNSKARRLTLSAPWDFDLGEGNKTSGMMNGNIYKSNDNFLNNKSYANGMTTFNPWLFMLSRTDFFNEMFKKYYSIFDKSGIYDKVVDYVNYEKVAFATDFSNTYTTVGLPNASGSTLMSTRQYNTHEEAVSYLLNWFQERKTFLDSTWLS